MSYDPLDHTHDDEAQNEGQERPTVPLEVLLTPADKQWLAGLHIHCGRANWFRAHP